MSIPHSILVCSRGKIAIDVYWSAMVITATIMSATRYFEFRAEKIDEAEERIRHEIEGGSRLDEARKRHRYFQLQSRS